jgi:hypothetical protein
MVLRKDFITVQEMNEWILNNKPESVINIETIVTGTRLWCMI